MNQGKIAILPLVLLTGICAFGQDKSKEQAKDKAKEKEQVLTFQGAIEDSQCAFNVHSESRSHEWMIKKGVANANDEKSCTLHCVKDLGGSYVLVIKKDVYRLDNQDKAEPFAGKDNVKILGTLDAKTHTIHVIDVSEGK